MSACVDLLYQDTLTVVFQSLSIQDRISAACTHKKWLLSAYNTRNCNDYIVFESDKIDTIRHAYKSPFFKHITSLGFQNKSRDEENSLLFASAIADVMQHIAHLVKELFFFGRSFPDNGFALILGDGFKNSHSLTEVDISSCTIGKCSAKALANLIRQNPKLQILDICRTKMKTEDLELVLDAIESNDSLTNLNVSNNALNSQGFKLLTKSLKNHATLHTLNLYNNKLQSDDDAGTLVDLLQNNHTLTNINLSKMGINQFNVEYISKSFQAIKTLDLSLNELDSPGVEILTQVLKSKVCITSLNLSSTLMKTKGMTVISKLIETSKSIKYLDVSNNQFDDQGTVELCKLIKANHPWLQTLYCNSIMFSSQDRAKLFESIKFNTNLTELSIRNINIGDDINKLAMSLQSNTSIKRLNVSNNKLGSKGIEILLDYIRTNQSITSLHLNENAITSTGFQAFADYIKHNSTIKNAGISSNIMCMQDVKILIDALSFNTSLAVLGMHWCTEDEIIKRMLRSFEKERQKICQTCIWF